MAIPDAEKASMWEDRHLRDVKEADVRKIVESGLQENSQLDYKADRTEDKKEFLLDICQFANASGGLLLIGIQELRENGKPTGVPDPTAELGIELSNAEAELLKLDSWIASGIEETLHIESEAIKIGENRRVIAIRVPNSTAKPHSVYLDKGRIYFPYRRERNREYLDVRDIKEMVMRTASRVEQAEAKLKTASLKFHLDDDQPRLIVGIIPVFYRDFILKISDKRVFEATSKVGTEGLAPRFTFEGLEHSFYVDSTFQVRRNGLIVLHARFWGEAKDGAYSFRPETLDIYMKDFTKAAAHIYQEAQITGPFVLGIMLRSPRAALAPRTAGNYRLAVQPPAECYDFPPVQTETLIDWERAIRPLCDNVHQMFGRKESNCFTPDGKWNTLME